MKLTIFNAFLNLFAIADSLFADLCSQFSDNYCQNTWLGEFPVGDMSQEGCKVRKVSVGEMSGRGSIRRGSVLRRSVSPGSVHEELSIFLRGTALQSSKKWPALFVENPVESLFL